MDRQRAERVAALFAAALALHPADRRAMLDRDCGDDEALLVEVLDLLDRDHRAGPDDFLGAATWPGEGVAPAPAASGVLGRYVDLRDPRPGGMGVVYRARDVELGRDVAYKVMNASFGRAEEFRLRFAREARITADLAYPGIVPVFGLVTDDSGRPAYAMQYVDGITFGALIRRPRAEGDESPPRDRLRAFASACRIVEFAHRRGYVHGDLSPGNLMVAQPGDDGPPDDEAAVFVVDWGLAFRVGPPRPGDEALGPTPGSAEPATPHFAAPSVLRGEPKTFVTDVYSLGAILASLASGVIPIGPIDLARPEFRALPRPLRAIIGAATADQEGGPYPTAGALADDVQRSLDGEKVRADAEPWRETAWRSIRRRPARAVVAVASTLLLLIAATSAALVSAARDRSATSDALASAARERSGRLVEALNASYKLVDLADPDSPGGEISLQARQAIAGQLMPYFDRVNELRGRDPETLRALALGLIGRARLQHTLGGTKEDTAALADLARAAEIYRELPASADSETGLANVAISQAGILGPRGKFAEAMAALGPAIPVLEASARESPARADVHLRLSRALSNRANCSRFLAQMVAEADPGRADTLRIQAEADFRQAIIEGRAALDAAPAELRSLDWLSRLRGNFGLMLLDLPESRRPESLAEAEAASRLADELIRRAPQSRSAGETLVAALINLGEMSRANRKLAEAEAAFRRAVGLYDQLQAQHPLILEFVWGQALARLSLGVTLLEQEGRKSEAIQALSEARTRYDQLVKDHPDVQAIAAERAELMAILAKAK